MTGGDFDPPAGFEDLPPSAKYVLRELDRDGPLTRQELLGRTYLAPTTLDEALDTLESRHFVHKARKNDDLRQVVAEIRQYPDA
ncbi:MarR family transcriptional regulator [Haloplanus litoreus]|uniref:MarR family transcriptional regulator n=1 Tax=Haloplanus litoreus TaxID=767515 RepID=A0ABD6A2Z2_9EURY